MATAAKTYTDAKTRSIELAAEHGQTACSHAAKLIGFTLSNETGGLASAAWRIASAHSDAQYVVTYTSGSGCQCECRAAQYGRHACWHAGLGWMMAMEIAKLYSAAGRASAEQEYRQDMARGY